MTREELLKASVNAYEQKRHEFELFRRGVLDFFSVEPELNRPPLPIIHSVRSRLKDSAHLYKKLERKWDDADPVTPNNIFRRITDLSGVRVLHLHQSQFPIIHSKIMARVSTKDWVLHEPPKAYSWDPEASRFYGDLGLQVNIKESYYTSIHYVVKPREDNPVCCEIQVRTLFEEIWGEIDHTINYPDQTGSVACREQLRVLAKLVSTGTRLADSIFRSHAEHEQIKPVV